MEEALRRAKKAGRETGCYYGGIILRSGRRGFAVYRDGKVVAQYTAMGRRIMAVRSPGGFGIVVKCGYLADV